MLMGSNSLLEKWFAAGDNGDLQTFDEILHPDVVVHAPLGLSTRGIEAEKAVWRDALEAMPNIRHEIKDVVVSGHIQAARAVVTGTLEKDFGGIAAKGQSFEVDQGLFARIQDDKIIEAWEIVDTVSLMRQLGASPD